MNNSLAVRDACGLAPLPASRPVPPESPAPSLDDLVLRNQAFVKKIARSYKNLGVPYEDLVNEGNLGLIEAARRFDPGRGNRFITYAGWWVRKAILRAVSRNALVVQVPEYRRLQVRSVETMRLTLSRDLGRAAGRDEVSEALHLSMAKTDSILQLKMKQLSLEEVVNQENDMTILERLVDERATSPENDMIHRENKSRLRHALRRLSPALAMILTSRYGLEGGRACTLKEVGDRLGMSRERVRQLELMALNKLWKAFQRPRPRKSSPHASAG